MSQWDQSLFLVGYLVSFESKSIRCTLTGWGLIEVDALMLYTIYKIVFIYRLRGILYPLATI